MSWYVQHLYLERQCPLSEGWRSLHTYLFATLKPCEFLLTTSCIAATYKPQSSSKKKSVTLVNSKEETDDWRNVQSALKGGVMVDDFDGLDGFGAFEL